MPKYFLCVIFYHFYLSSSNFYRLIYEQTRNVAVLLHYFQPTNISVGGAKRVIRLKQLQQRNIQTNVKVCLINFGKLRFEQSTILRQ